MSSDEHQSSSPSQTREGIADGQVTATLLATVLDQVGQGVIVVSVKGRFLVFNPAARDLLGRGPTKLPPERWAEFYGLFEAGGEGRLLSGAEMPLLRAMAGEEVHDLEMTVRRPESVGEPLRVRAHAWPLRGEDDALIGGIVTLHDVSQARRTEQLLRTGESRYRALTELVSDHAYEFEIHADRSMTVSWMSAAFGALAGFTQGERVSRERFRSFIHPADREVFRAHRMQLEAGLVHEAEFRVIGVDGSVRWVRNKVRPVRGEGDEGLIHVLGAARDITDEKLLDPLTNLPNRAALLDRISVAMKRLVRDPDAAVAVLFVDMDRFQVFNESLGYGVGDQLLCLCADRIQEAIAPGDTVAHLHGDEFGVLLTELDFATDALRVAQEIAAVLATPAEIGGTRVAPSASVGIAFAGSAEDDPVDLLRSAQTAVARAKKAGRGRYEVYDPAMQRAAMTRLRLEAALREALDESRFPVLYQPIVRLTDRQVVGFEALVRWDDPEKGVLSPSEFVPLAEETGLIVEIGDHVLRTACRQMQAWRETVPEAAKVVMSVNVSARQIAVGDLLDRLDSALDESGLDSRGLKLEITESLLVADPEAAEALLQAVRSRGICLGLDDFGTGHSALAYLQRFPIDTLKVDRSFVSRLQPGGEAEGIVDTIVALAKHLSLDVVAEGVETEAQCEAVKRLGCSHGQGFLFAPPLAADEALACLLASRA